MRFGVPSQYLELLKRVLTDTVTESEPHRGAPGFAEWFISHYFENQRPFTCVPVERLDHLEQCIRQVIAERVPGDLLEAGIWRGGVTMFMRAVLKELDVTDRRVWGADSFEGLPRPTRGPSAKETIAFDSPAMERLGRLAVPRSRVEQGFRRFGLMDEQVRLLPGWFDASLPQAPIDQLAILRIDADFYASTLDVLNVLYEKVSPGGFIVVDDYGEDNWTDCRAAVDEFRRARAVTEAMEPVDPYCWFWQKRAEPAAHPARQAT
jgi:hypothetical protein